MRLVAAAPRERLQQFVGGAAVLAHSAAAEISLLLAASNLVEGEPGTLRDSIARAPRSTGPGMAAMKRLVKLERRLIPLHDPEYRRRRLEEAQRLSVELLEGTSHVSAPDKENIKGQHLCINP